MKVPSKPLKIVLGIASILPLIGMVLFFKYIFSGFFDEIVAHDTMGPNGMPSFFGNFKDIMKFQMILMFVTYGTMLYFALHLFKLSRIKENEKIMWLLLMLFVGMITMPLYWLLHIWSQPEVSEDLDEL